jgi:transposase-like protein
MRTISTIILHPNLIVRMLEEERGSASAVARRLGCGHATVRYWRRVAVQAGMDVPPGLTPRAARRLGKTRPVTQVTHLPSPPHADGF